MNEELVAIAILGALPVVEMLDLDFRLGFRRERELVAERSLLAQQGRDEAVDENRQAETAGVDDVVLLQDGQQLGRPLNRCVRFPDDFLKRLFHIELLLVSALRSRSRILQNREDGALNRLADSLERNFDGAREGGVDGGR